MVVGRQNVNLNSRLGEATHVAYSMLQEAWESKRELFRNGAKKKSAWLRHLIGDQAPSTAPTQLTFEQ